jgi:NADP-dependent 3-hydroxy acid dehydrogenase YdfG
LSNTENLKVTTIVPDIINSEFYQEQDFEPSTNDDAYINVNDIAELIVDLIESKKNYNLSEIVIKPQRFEINRKKTDSK